MSNTMKIPPPGLQGDYRGTCIGCLRPTDTAIGFTGEAEWILAGLVVLGLPEDQAYWTMLPVWREQHGTTDGDVPSGVLTEVFRACRDCARATGAEPVLAARGAEIPCIGQPDDGDLGEDS